MSNLIKYDGNPVFVGQADPLVSKTTEYVQGGERWGTIENITLNGTITGTSFNNIYIAQSQIYQKFQEDFKTLMVTGFGEFESCRIGSIDFSESDYLSNSTYNISLQSYGTGNSLLYTHGVTNPVNSVEYSENDDLTVGATRTISAKGVNIANKTNAIDNAIQFIAQYTGLNRQGTSGPFGNNWVTAPFFVKNATNGNMPMILTNQSQSINRFTAEVSLTEEYIIDATGDADFNPGYVLRYTEASTSSDSSRDHITINGTIDGSKYSTQGITGAFAYYNRFKESFDEFLYNESITQDIKNSSLSFSFEYDEGYDLDIVPDIKVSVSENSDSSLISVSVNGTISTKDKAGGAFERVKTFFEEEKYTLPYFHGRAAYLDYLEEHDFPDNDIKLILTLNPMPLSESVTEDRENASISFSYSYDDRFSKLGIGVEAANPDSPLNPEGSQRLSLDLSLSFKPMVEQIATIETINGFKYFDMGFHSLASFGLNMNIVGRDLLRDGDAQQMDDSIRSIIQRYCNPVGPLPDKTFTQKGTMESATESKKYAGEILDQKGYSFLWNFVSTHKLTDHVDNEGAGGFVNDNSSFLI